MNRGDHDRRLFQARSANQRSEDSKAGLTRRAAAQVRIVVPASQSGVVELLRCVSRFVAEKLRASFAAGQMFVVDGEYTAC
jgi:hypothetical protein